MSQRIEIAVYEVPDVVLGFDGDAAGERAIWSHVERQFPKPPPMRTAPDWELEAQREHWARMGCRVDGAGELFVICREAARDIDAELERRRNLPYQRTKSPFVWPEIFAQIKDRADLLSIICARRPDTALGNAIRSQGRKVHIRCPFHAEKTASMVVYTDDQHYHCFGCKASGDAIDAVQKLDGLSFMEAVQALAQEFGIVLPRTHR